MEIVNLKPTPRSRGFFKKPVDLKVASSFRIKNDDLSKAIKSAPS